MSSIFTASLFNRVLIVAVALSLSACASSLLPNFQYETSLRGQQGIAGQSERQAAAQTLLDAGVVTDPALALQAALPDADITLRKWGLRYFDADWVRYQVVLDADIERGDDETKCREVSMETPVGAPTLNELRENDGFELQLQLEALTAACLREVANPAP